MLTVFAVSDATGVTAERVVGSGLAQFGGADVQIVRRGGVRTVEDVRRVVQEAAATEAFILHTLVSLELRREMLEAARALPGSTAWT